MEEDYIIRTQREGTVASNDTIEGTITKMGTNRLNDRLTGVVTVIVEKEGGTITKDKIRYGQDNSEKFNLTVKANAELLLGQVKDAVSGGGDDGDLRVKVVAKK